MSKHDILKKYDYIKLNSIKTGDVSQLFQFLIRRLYNTGKYNTALSHIQMSNLVFGEKDSIYLKKVRNEYRPYFIVKGSKSLIDFDKAYEDHPHIWTDKKVETRTFSKKDILSAIDSEIKESYRSQNNNYISIAQIQEIEQKPGLRIYRANLIIENDDFITFSEGAKVKLKYGDYSSQTITILNFDAKSESLLFQTNKEVKSRNGRVQSSNVSVLFKLKERIEAIEEKDIPIWNLLNGKNFPKKLKDNEHEIWDQGLDESQKNCLKQSLSNDITYIWGPPGTGKSHTLARVLLNLYNRNEKTVICSIANVAVDGLLLKTVDVFKDDYFTKKRKDLLAERKIVRIGFSQSDEIRNTPEIKFENLDLKLIASKLDFLDDKINEFNEGALTEKKEIELSKLKSNRISLKNELQRESKKLLKDSKMIFLTASKDILDDAVNELEIDNLVIDEGSMMSIPLLLAIGHKVKKRIIIAGDFRQLGPVALSGSLNAKRWLHSDLFTLLSKSQDKPNVNHPALTMITNQRRSHTEIAELINGPFYENRLQTINQLHHYLAKDCPPSKGHVSFIELPNDETNQSGFSRTKSKYNSLSRIKTLESIKKIIENSPPVKTIGIITPYRQQVIDYQKNLLDFNDNPIKIKVGTIHTFQGSECDIIFWDMVDTGSQPVGSLYKGVTGEKLVNVAVSRAKSKLVIVGYPRTFNECDGRDTVSSKVKRLVADAWKQFENKKIKTD